MRALIFGITGQDGSYLAELLLSKGYEIHGVQRRTSSRSTGRIDGIYDQLCMHYGDITDSACIARLLAEIRPDEIYNLAAQSHVGVSFEVPEYTADCDAIGALRVLDAMKSHCPESRLYHASTSEMFGAWAPPQHEDTPFRPMSPYACAKVFAHQCVGNYRAAYGLHASCGILFNHESPRRGETFVTAKICKAAALQRQVTLGTLDTSRDWGHARDYVRAMWLMLQQDKPDDYVIATGESHTVRECCELAYSLVGLDYRDYVTVDKSRARPLEVPSLLGDARKAKMVLGWEPAIRFEGLIKEMVYHYMACHK